jgi:hypothetical protein
MVDRADGPRAEVVELVGRRGELHDEATRDAGAINRVGVGFNKLRVITRSLAPNARRMVRWTKRAACLAIPCISGDPGTRRRRDRAQLMTVMSEIAQRRQCPNVERQLRTA